MEMPPIAVIAGGLGTRLYPVTQSIPKSLVMIGDRPFVAHQLDLFARRGLREVIFCVGHLGEQIEEYVGDGSRFDLHVRYSYDGETMRGTGGAVLNALPKLGDAFLVTYGDSYLDTHYDRVFEAFRSSAAPALMTVFRNDDHFDRSNVEMDGARIVVYDKANRSPRMRHIDYGLLAMTPAAFAGLERAERFDLAALLGSLAGQGRLAGYEVGTRFYECGSVSGVADLAAHLSAGGKGLGETRPPAMPPITS